MKPLRTLSIVLIALSMAAPLSADAQIWKKVKKAAKRTVENEAERKTERAVRGALNLAEDVVVCMAGDDDCAEEAEKDGKEYVVADEDGNVVSDHRHSSVEEVPDEKKTETPSEKPQKPGEGVWANYDFVPGERVIFADDFEKDRVGDFPRRLEFVKGNMEVVEWEGQRLLRSNAPSKFAILLSESLPERFTIEFDFHQPAAHICSYIFTDPNNTERSQYKASYFQFCHTSGVMGPVESALQTWRTRESLTAVRIHVDGEYVKVYLDDKRVSNLPRAEILRSNKIVVNLAGHEKHSAYFGNVRIAAGGGDLYDALKEAGRVTTQGILFDTGSDRIRPESTPTLEEIGRMLQEHEELRIAIEGHTDSVGDDASNMDLSKRRAQSVLRYLVDELGVSEDRLQSEGFGETKPVGSNETPEGRQNNRRVELVDLTT